MAATPAPSTLDAAALGRAGAGAVMGVALLVVGASLLLVALGITLVRTGHPRAVTPVVVGAVGLIVLVAGAVLVARIPSGAAGPKLPPIPVTVAEPAVCPTAFHGVWTDHLPGPTTRDAQA